MRGAAIIVKPVYRTAAVKLLFQRKAKGNRWALYSRSFIQKALHSLGTFVQVIHAIMALPLPTVHLISINNTYLGACVVGYRDGAAIILVVLLRTTVRTHRDRHRKALGRQ